MEAKKHSILKRICEVTRDIIGMEKSNCSKSELMEMYRYRRNLHKQLENINQ